MNSSNYILQKIEDERQRNSPQLTLWVSIILIPNQRNHQKRNLETCIPHEYQCKHAQQNIRKLNPATYIRDYTPWPTVIHPRNARVIPYLKINVICNFNKITKGCDHLNKHRKSIWQNSTSFMLIKNSRRNQDRTRIWI